MKLPKGLIADLLALLVVAFIIVFGIKRFYYDGAPMPDTRPTVFAR